MLYKNEPPTFEKSCYCRIKNLFLTELKNTYLRCQKMYNNKYDQERNYNVSIHPEIEKNRICAERSHQTVREELAYIEKSNQPPLQKAAALIEYAEGLMTTPFHNLFMIILKGKLKKHALTNMKNIQPNTKLREIPLQHYETLTNAEDITGFILNK